MSLQSVASALTGRSTPERTARASLREAFAARQMAELALQSKIENVQRLNGIIQSAAAAESVALQAKAAAEAGAAAWAHAGAKDDDTGHHEALIEESTQRRRQADIAAIRANGARQALLEAEDAVASAKLAIQEAGWRISRAKGAILFALAEPTIARAKQARQEYLQAFNEIRGLGDVDDDGRNEANRRNLVSGLPPIHHLLNELSMPRYVVRGDEIRREAPGLNPEQWIEFAKRLATDPDAAFNA